MTYPTIEKRTELRFPTMAEEAVQLFKTSKVTISLAGICQFNKAECTFDYPRTIYTFDDGSSVQTTGRGKNYHCETLLP